MKVNFYRKVEGSLPSTTARLRDIIKENRKKGFHSKLFFDHRTPLPVLILLKKLIPNPLGVSDSLRLYPC